MHMIDPFQERQREQQREPKWREMMQQLDVEVVGIGGWELVQSVKVEGKKLRLSLRMSGFSMD